MERSSLVGIFRIYTRPPRYRRRISFFRKSTVSGSKNHANDHSRAKVRAGQEESSSGPPERTGECFPKLFRTSSDGGQTCPVSDGRKSRIPAISSITGRWPLEHFSVPILALIRGPRTRAIQGFQRQESGHPDPLTSPAKPSHIFRAPLDEETVQEKPAGRFFVLC